MLCSGIFLKGLSPLLGFGVALLLYRYSRYLQTGILVNSEDSDEMKHYAHFIRYCTVGKDKHNVQGEKCIIM